MVRRIQKADLKRKPKRDDPEQSELFIEVARELGSDETGEGFRKALKKIASPTKRRPEGA